MNRKFILIGTILFTAVCCFALDFNSDAGTANSTRIGSPIKSGGVSGGVLYEDASGNVAQDSNLTFDGTDFGLTGGQLNLTYSSPGDSFSSVNLSFTGDYTIAKSTSGTNANTIYSYLNGDYLWGTHMHGVSGKVGVVNFASGVHGPDSYGFLSVIDSTSGYVLRGIQDTASYAGNLIELNAETVWESVIYPSLTPSYAGTFTGNFLSFKDRSVEVFKVNSAGQIYTYDPAGTDAVAIYHNGSTGVVQSTADSLSLAAANGAYTYFSPDLGNTTTISVPNNSDTVITPSEGNVSVASELAVTGGAFVPYSRTTAQLEAITPGAAGEYYFCSDCSTAGLYRSTGTTLGAFVWEGDGTTAN